MNSIYIGADHGGFELKEKIKIWLKSEGYIFEDLGAHSLVSDDDYPEYAFAVSKKVIASIDKKKDAIGILFCRSGGGMVIAANKVRGIKAISIHDEETAILAKEKNDANIISISADSTSEKQTKKILLAFFKTPFSGIKRHSRRVDQIKKFESSSRWEL